TRLAWRGVFHPDGHRAAAARYPRADLPAPAAAARLKLTPRSRRRCRPRGCECHQAGTVVSSDPTLTGRAPIAERAKSLLRPGASRRSCRGCAILRVDRDCASGTVDREPLAGCDPARSRRLVGRGLTITHGPARTAETMSPRPLHPIPRESS